MDINDFSSGEKIFKKIQSCRFNDTKIKVVGIRERFINVLKNNPLKAGSYLNYLQNLEVKRKDY